MKFKILNPPPHVRQTDEFPTRDAALEACGLQQPKAA